MFIGMAQESSVEDLVRRAQEGDPGAFAAISDLYRRRVEALAASRMAPALRRKIPVDDVVQETFVRAFESIGRFRWRGEDSFMRWIGTISRNVVARAAREKGISLDLELSHDLGEFGVEILLG